jgi:hypothetical protein
LCWHVAERSNYLPEQTRNSITAEGKNEKEDLKMKIEKLINFYFSFPTFFTNGIACDLHVNPFALYVGCE